MPTVSIKDTGKTVEVQEGEVLYDSLCDRGLVLPHGCLSGSCGACRVEVLEGKENLAAPGLIEQNTIDDLKKEYSTDKEIRLSCRAKVLGNVTIKPI